MSEVRIVLDAIDQRGPSRRRREQPLEDDERRFVLEDGLQSLDRLRVRKNE